MSISPRCAAVYAIDCSKTMGISRSFTIGTGENAITSEVTPLEVMIKYVKVKVAQRMMRSLKTTPLAVIVYATSKTKNILTTRQKDNEGEDYDKDEDLYRGFAEAISFSYNPNASMLTKLDQVVAGKGLDVTSEREDAADILNAIIIAVETLDQEPKCSNYADKEVVILTDGESKTSWDDWKNAAQNMVDRNISLTVVGMGFTKEGDEPEEEKSATKIENESKLQEFVDYLDEHKLPSIFATAHEALISITAPRVQEVRPTIIKTTISIGDSENRPDRSIVLHIDIQKTIMPATLKSMKEMSLLNFETKPSNHRSTQSQSQNPNQSQYESSYHNNNGASTSNNPPPVPPPESEFSRSFYMGDLGSTFEDFLEMTGLVPKIIPGIDPDLATNAVKKESILYYRPPDKLLEEGKDFKKTVEEELEEEEVVEKLPVLEEVVLPGTELTEAYRYGGTAVPVTELDNGVGSLKGLRTGMQIIAFMKKSDIPYEMRMGDLLDVTASPGQTGSQLMFSAFINGMVERKSVAIVRYVGKMMRVKGVERFPDPKIGILSPCLELPGHEFCYWAQMPFSEDISILSVPALHYVRRKQMMIESDHKYLPTPDMDKAMEEFVDAMDLMEDGEVDEDGEPTEWFSTSDSYSPAIHNLQNTLIARLVSTGPLPPIPDSITKYANPPLAAIERSKESREKLVKFCNVSKVPPKPKKIAKSKTDNYVPADEVVASGAILEDFGTDDHFGSLTSNNIMVEIEEEREDSEEDDEMEVDQVVRDKVSVYKKEDEEDSEPSTQDEEEDDDDMVIVESTTTTNNDDTLSSADQAKYEKVLKSEGVESSINWMFKQAYESVTSSFSTVKYPIGITSIKIALEHAKKNHKTQIYNEKLREMAKLIIGSPRNGDFARYMKDAGLTLLIDDKVTEEDATAFTLSLSN